MALPTIRPDFGPTQIKEANELVCGERYVMHHNHLPGQDNAFVFSRVEDNKLIHQNGYLALADCGLAPYISALGEQVWNDTNWVENNS